MSAALEPVLGLTTDLLVETFNTIKKAKKQLCIIST